MAQVSLPAPLRELLSGSTQEVPVIELADAVGALLHENNMPFFSGYTDHGAAHVEGVLETSLKLIPEEVWSQELLNAEDAAVLACGAMLHDLAMHVREAGFVALVADDTPFEPSQWFSQDQDGRKADLPWADLWRAFQREARHFGVGQLDVILGPGAEVPDVAHEASLDPGNWKDDDRLLIGEFLRRHHARLAHEISLYGFPGWNPDDFPVLRQTLKDLGSAAGLVARSHNEPLWLMRDHLQFLAPGSKRPKGALLLYEMALLRVADYLQIESGRAPLPLLRLKNPQSPRSVQEWQKHGAVSSVVWDHSDPLAIYVSVAAHHSLRTHLALVDLLADLRAEMEASSAVLDAEFGVGDLSALNLRKRRILTDLEERSLHEQLPYIPRRAALRSDPDLFRLVIGDLYGKQPSVAGRELVQNAVDAVRARRGLEDRTGRKSRASDLRRLKADVMVTLEERDEDEYLLRVSDQGIGMPPDLVVDYFLQAGASFGPTSSEREEGDDKEAVRTLKTGRFGVGAFAAFLLGPEIRVTTRHVAFERGVTFKARLDEDLVEMAWTKAPIGTEIEVPIDCGKLPSLAWTSARQAARDLLKDITSFYRLKDPKVAYEYRLRGEKGALNGPADVPKPEGRLPESWRKFEVPRFEGVLWKLPKREWPTMRDEFLSHEGGALIHNGILIRPLSDHIVFDEAAYDWSDAIVDDLIRRPTLAVFDSRHLLPVSLHRYNLGDRRLPFERQLLESIGLDLVANGLVAGAGNHPIYSLTRHSAVFSRSRWMPLLPSLMKRYMQPPLFVLWQLENRHVAPIAQWPVTKAFLKPSGGVPWRDLRHRAAVTLERIGLRNHEGDYWENLLDEVGFNVDNWSQKRGGKILGTVLMRKDAAWDEKSPFAAGAAPHKDWRGLPSGRGNQGGIFLQGKAPVDPDVERQLLTAAMKLREIAPPAMFGISAIDSFSDESPADEALAAGWVRHVDGLLERDQRRRTGQADEILSSAPKLRPLVGKWRRILESES